MRVFSCLTFRRSKPVRARLHSVTSTTAMKRRWCNPKKLSQISAKCSTSTTTTESPSSISDDDPISFPLRVTILGATSTGCSLASNLSSLSLFPQLLSSITINKDVNSGLCSNYQKSSKDDSCSLLICTLHNFDNDLCRTNRLLPSSYSRTSRTSPSINQTKNIKLHSGEEASNLENSDLILVTTKSYQTEQVAQFLQEELIMSKKSHPLTSMSSLSSSKKSPPTIVLFQTGINNFDIFQQHLSNDGNKNHGGAVVLDGVTDFHPVLVAEDVGGDDGNNGDVINSTAIKSCISHKLVVNIEKYRGTIHEQRILWLRQVLRSKNFELTLCPSNHGDEINSNSLFRRYQMGQLLLDLIQGVMTVTGLTPQQFWNNPEAQWCALQCILEGYALLKKLGHRPQIGMPVNDDATNGSSNSWKIDLFMKVLPYVLHYMSAHLSVYKYAWKFILQNENDTNSKKRLLQPFTKQSSAPNNNEQNFVTCVPMWYDLVTQCKTEIHNLNGYIVQKAKYAPLGIGCSTHRFHTPGNEIVTQLVQEQEKLLSAQNIINKGVKASPRDIFTITPDELVAKIQKRIQYSSYNT